MIWKTIVNTRLGLFTIYKKVPENPVGKKMEHAFLGLSSG